MNSDFLSSDSVNSDLRVRLNDKIRQHYKDDDGYIGVLEEIPISDNTAISNIVSEFEWRWERDKDQFRMLLEILRNRRVEAFLIAYHYDEFTFYVGMNIPSMKKLYPLFAECPNNSLNTVIPAQYIKESTK